MDILVTFDDGTTELRDAGAPYIYHLDGLTNLPPHPSEERWYMPPDEESPLSFAGRAVREIGNARGFKFVHVWRITKKDPETKALTGEWASCRVETVGEQIARLTRERDVEKVHAARWKKAARRLRWWAHDEAQGVAHLRRGAKAMLAVFSDERTDDNATGLFCWGERGRVGQRLSYRRTLSEVRS